MSAALRRLPWGLLGMLVLVAGVERFVSRHEVEFSSPENLDWRGVGRAAREKTRDRDFLVFGTSMTQQGLLPSILGEKTGGHGYNLALCAGQPASSYFLLKRALDSGSRPKAVLVDFPPHYLSAPYSAVATFWPHLLEPSEGLDLAWMARDASFFASTALAHALPSLGGRRAIRGAIFAALSGEANPSPTHNLMFMHNKNQNLGALLHPKQPAFHGEIAPAFAGSFLPEGWAVDAVNAAYVQRFVALAGSFGVTVYWVIPPLSPELQRRRDLAGLDAAYNEFVRSVQAEHANLVVLDGRKSGYAEGVFMDAAHLDSQGARAFSSDVGDAVASRRGEADAARRWLILPAYHDRPAGSPLMDLSGSAIAIGAGLPPRR